MPTYSYRCTQCDNALEVHQAFTEDSLTVCPACGGQLRKIFSGVGVTFNGSGFYRTDSRATQSEKPKATGSQGSQESTSSGGTGGGSGDTSGGSRADSGSASSGPPSSEKRTTST